jgi:hypothetical protein
MKWCIAIKMIHDNFCFIKKAALYHLTGEIESYKNENNRSYYDLQLWNISPFNRTLLLLCLNHIGGGKSNSLSLGLEY